ncbi:MAG: GNAT family N-acetyltransferase [Eubacteriales bacterium]|nr:GNAT family N-acetyltransferase [Eubacteriales bacterium]
MKTLQTERIILREWIIEDAKDLFEYASSPNVGPAAGWMPHKSIEETREYLALTMADGDTWALVYKPENKVIGSVGLHKDGLRGSSVRSKSIGYVMNESYWGKGIMTEAVREVMRFAFDELDMQILTLEHFSGNQRSRRVILKCGFIFEGIHKNHHRFDDKMIDLWTYSITKDEWLGMGTRRAPNYRFYQNRQCEYFPCHRIDDIEKFSCQFCYCPLYANPKCGGNFVLLSNGVKDCSNCLRPHVDYDAIVERLK